MNDYSSYPVGRRTYGKNTQTAATAIVQLIEPWKDAETRIVGLQYTDLGTSHSITFMRPCNKTTVAADAAAGQASFTLTADPGLYSAGGTFATADNLIAANDYLAYQAADGTWVGDKVAAVAGLNIGMTVNLPTGGVKAGAPVFFYGTAADLNPNNHQVHPQLASGTASTSLTFKQNEGFCISTIQDVVGLKVNNGVGQPVLIFSNNATAAGVLQYVAVEYVHPAFGRSR